MARLIRRGANRESRFSRRQEWRAAPGLLVLLSSGCALTQNTPLSPPWRERIFRVGVYLNRQAPTALVFEALGRAGVDFVWLNQKNYRYMAQHERLHALAARHRIGIYVQLFAQLEADEPESVARARIRDTRDFIDRQPHREMVIGYGVSDEPELNYPPDEHPEVSARAARFVQLIKAIDPRRRTLTTRYGTRWHPFRADEVWCNVFGADLRHLDRFGPMWRVVRAAGHRSFVALACGRPAPELSDERESTAEEPASTPEGSSAAPADTREHYVYQYALAAYLAGAEGVVFYIFDGTPADRAWSLVDPTGQDIDGKWSALQAAIAEVRASGAPTAASRAATAPQSRSR